MPHIEVCLSPHLLSLHNFDNKIAVVVDILRATSCITTAIAHGVKSILPLQDVETCRNMKKQGYCIAAEREGKKVEGFDLGNSPFCYMNPALQGQKIAFTTTNGTQVIQQTKQAQQVLIGSFLNLSSLCIYLTHQNKDVIIACAGWKGQVNAEDTLFAGALTQKLTQMHFIAANDSALIAQKLYEYHQNNLLEFLKTTSHYQRLKKLNIEQDITFCLQKDLYNVVPILKDGEIVKSD